MYILTRMHPVPYKYSYEEEECYPEKGIDRVKPFVEWIKQNKFHGFIGEYGIPDNDPRWNETPTYSWDIYKKTESMVHIGLGSVVG